MFRLKALAPALLQSPLPVEACEARLLEAVDTPVTYMGDKGFKGEKAKDRLVIWKSPVPRSSMQTRISLSLTPAEAGTAIQGQFRPGAYRLVDLVVTLGLCVAVVAIFFSLIGSTVSFWSGAALVPAIASVFAASRLAGARNHLTAEREELIQFVSRTVESETPKQGE
jgi:hypothetical protein